MDGEGENNNQGSSVGLVRKGLCPQQPVPKGLWVILPDQARTHYHPAQPWSLRVYGSHSVA